MVVPAWFIIYYIPIAAVGSILHSMEYEQKQIITWDSVSRCLSENRKLQCLQLPVWSVFSVNVCSINKTWMVNRNFHRECTILIGPVPYLFSVAQAISSTVELVNCKTSDLVNSFNYAMCIYVTSCFPIELVPCSERWWRTWYQKIHIRPGLLSPQFHSANRTTTKMHAENYSKQ